MAWARFAVTASLLLSACWFRPAAGWTHASPGEFHETIAGDETVLVAFVSPNEPKSSSLEPEWLSASSSTEGTHRLISIDCSAPTENNHNPCDRGGIDSLPLILLFNKGGFLARYNGPRRAGALLHFAARLTRPSVTYGLSASDLTKFKTADEVVFVAYVDPADPQPAEMLADVARRFREEFTFGVVADPAVADSQGVKIPSVVCYKTVDGDTVQFTSFDEGIGALEGWVAEASRPVIGELTELNRERITARGWPVVYVFAETEGERQTLRRALYKFARTYYDSLTTVLADPNDFPELVRKLGLEGRKFPAGAVHQLSKDRVFHYPLDKPLTPGAIQQWGLDVYQGRIKPWTPPGVTTTYDDLGLTKQGTAKVSLMSAPGVTIRVAGHDEL